MDILLGPVLEFVISGASHLAYQTVAVRVSEYLKFNAHKKKATQIRQFLDELGVLTEASIRDFVNEWLDAKPEDLSDEQREELIATLVNLARGARFLTTQGTPRSSFLRSERLLQQLLEEIQPVRKKGEKVGPGHDWILQRYLGIGKFGEVWMGENPGYPERRAFKFFTNSEAQEWLKREQHNLYEIKQDLQDHPNLICFLDVVACDTTYPFLVFEYVGGGSLEDWIVEDPEVRIAITPEDIVRGVVDGLAAAHQCQIYHRDLKPANILLSKELRPVAKITDFGLGRVTHAGAGMSATMSQAQLVGTSMYLPPEAQTISGIPDWGKYDVFALGVVWYQLLVEKLERPPYDFASRLKESNVDSRTIDLISRCLANPDRRFEDAIQLKEEMVDFMPPHWKTPPGHYDVQHIMREFISTQLK